MLLSVASSYCQFTKHFPKILFTALRGVIFILELRLYGGWEEKWLALVTGRAEIQTQISRFEIQTLFSRKAYPPWPFQYDVPQQERRWWGSRFYDPEQVGSRKNYSVWTPGGAHSQSSHPSLKAFDKGRKNVCQKSNFKPPVYCALNCPAFASLAIALWVWIEKLSLSLLSRKKSRSPPLVCFSFTFTQITLLLTLQKVWGFSPHQAILH